MKRFHCLGFLKIVLIFCLFLSCRKDLKNDAVVLPGEILDLNSKVASSVSGFVTDENNAAVSGAEVKVGDITVMTDRFGYFSVKNVQVVRQAATVTVSYPGYFRLVKTYFAEENNAKFLRMKLLPKTIAGTIDAATGGTINIPGGSTVTFPANAIKTATGTAYSGQVNVAAQYLDPTSGELYRIMPGNLSGVDTENRIRLLTTYGMIAVELMGASGETLQIADGKKATITLPIPASYAATAPVDMPLWFFDENSGLWKEEGAARRNANQYIGEVSHFSFWNGDLSNRFVHVNCRIVTEDGNTRIPMPYSKVRFTEVGNVMNTASELTGVDGITGGQLPMNTTLLMEVFVDAAICRAPVETRVISVGTSDLYLGDIVVTLTNPAVATVSGTVSACNGSAVGFASVMVSGFYENFPVLADSAGNFNFRFIYCAPNPLQISLVAFDFGQNLAGVDTLITLAPNDDVVLPLYLCSGNVIFTTGSTGYFYHPTIPRAILNLDKDLIPINTTTVECPLGDIGSQNYRAYFEKDPMTNLVTVTTAPGAQGGPYLQWDAGLPTTAPGPIYTAEWGGSGLCNNTYDPATRQYRMRYGYIGATGYRVSEEVIQLP